MKAVRIYDRETGESHDFRTMTEASKYIREVFPGSKAEAGAIHRAIGHLYRDRLEISLKPTETTTKKPTVGMESQNRKIGEWLFTVFKCAPTVIVAERRRIRFYDEDRFEHIEYELKKMGVARVVWDTQTELSKKEKVDRRTTRCEVYLKTDKPFNEQVKTLNDILLEKESLFSSKNV